MLELPWTNIISFIALGISVIVLVVTVYYNRKSLSHSEDVLNISKQQLKQIEYIQVIDIVKKSKNGYDIFPKLNEFFDSYSGVWIDEGIKKYVRDKADAIVNFERNSEFAISEPEPEQREISDEEISQHLMEQQEDIDNMNQFERYNYEFDQEFGNVKNELLRLLRNELKKFVEKVN